MADDKDTTKQCSADADGELKLSRRGVVGGLAVGVAASALPIAVAQHKSGTGAKPGDPAQGPLQDPTKLYSQPPFPRQTQPPPGIQGRMNPRPDCGEASYRGSGKLTGRKALITGGDSGIGRAAAIAIAREGADVAINYLPVEQPDANEVVQLIKAEGRVAAALPGDIRDAAFCRKLVSDAVSKLGGLDILVHVAGRQQSRASIAELSDDDFDATFKTNVYALFWITKAAMPHLPPGAAIINTASVQAYSPDAHLLDYASTKATIVAFTKSLAKQVAKRGIRVNAVAPGPFWTALQISGGQAPDAIPQFGANTAFGRPGQPAELGPLYVLLASRDSTYASGQVLGESGGRGVP